LLTSLEGGDDRVRIRLARPLTALLCLAAFATAAAPATATALTVGISDDTVAMFSQPDFTSVNISTARYLVSWNAAVTKNHQALDQARAWINAAKQAGVTPLISFGGNGNYIPSVPVYTAAIKAFVRDFPSVKLYTPWNEPDWIYRSLSRKPGLAASYFNVLVQNCHHCTIVAGDVYQPAKQLGPWLRAYRKGLRYRPAAWALHNYDDVRTHTTSQLRTMESLTSGPIWLTEISGVERRGHWPYPNQGVFAAARDENFLFSLPKRFHRVTRIYHYQWQALPWIGWDSGLIGPAGVPRPAYWTLANAAGRRTSASGSRAS
jgi:Glycosyl hydrolase catalytic core